MVEFRTSDLPECVKCEPLKLGHCPHGVQMVSGEEVYTDFPQIYWSFHKESGKDASSWSRELNTSVKVSVFWGLAKGSVEHSHRASSSKSKNSHTIESVCRVEKGILSLRSVKPVEGSRCTKGNCKYGPYYVHGISVGAEASLTVTMDTKTECDDSSCEVGGGVKVLGASLGDTLQSYVSFFEGNCSIDASYTSSNDEPVILKPAAIADEDVQAFVWEVQNLEDRMVAFPERVTRLPRNSDLYCTYIFEPVARLLHGPCLDGFSLKLEIRMRIEYALKELLDVKGEAGQIQGLEAFVEDIACKIQKLEDMRACDDATSDRVKHVYGDHAVNFYRRELKRLRKRL